MGLTNALLAILALLCATTVHSREVYNNSIVSHWPQSTAIRVGQEGRINFTIVNGRPFTLLSLQAGFVGAELLEPIYQGSLITGVIQGTHGENFERIPEKMHDIKIRSMNWTLAGTYRASVTIEIGKEESKQFAIAAVDPATCDLRNSDNTVEEDDIVNLDCSTSYTGPGNMKPTMEWANEEGKVLPGYYVVKPPSEGDDPPKTTPAPNEPKLMLYRTNLTATKDHDGKQFNCSLSFKAADGKSAITYTDQCSETFWVKFAVTTIMFSPDPTPDAGRYKTGDLLNCSARGNPAPKYRWTGTTVNGDIFQDGSSLVMTDGMVGGLNTFTCKATNKLRGQVHEIARNVTFHVTHGSSGTGSHMTATIGIMSLIAFVIMRLF